MSLRWLAYISTVTLWFLYSFSKLCRRNTRSLYLFNQVKVLMISHKEHLPPHCSFTKPTMRDLSKETDFRQIGWSDIQDVQKLGKGVFGLVFKATLRLPDQPQQTVVIKMPRLPGTDLVTEGRVLYDMDGAEGVAPRLLGITLGPRGKWGLVMEYFSGSTFTEYMRSNPNPAYSTVVKQIDIAVAAISNKGYKHMDLHGGNIIVDDTSESLTVRLIDFGQTQKIEE